MKYVITKEQFHNIVYGVLDEMLEDGKVEKEINPYVESGKTYRLNMFDKNGEIFITYFYFEPGEDDYGIPHDDSGSIHVHWQVDEKIRK